MIHDLEYQSSEFEGGFAEEFEFDSGELEAYEGESDMESGYELEEESGAKVGFNLPKIGDRSGFQEIDLEFDQEIFPPDDRKPVTDTTKIAYRFICHLFIGMKAADGTIATGRGSGTLISNNQVLTVAHNLKISLGGKSLHSARRSRSPPDATPPSAIA
ncbi:MAG: hypothetical protein QM757_34650 [Paludibaculum sp.]